MKLSIPEFSLVVLVGASGAGKSSFARAHFRPTEVLSSDFCRGLVADDENDQAATGDAFDVLHYVAAKRLAAGRLTVVDATNVQPEARAPLVALARAHDCLPVAVVLDLPERLCQERNRARPTASSARTSSAASARRSGDPCAGWGGRASATSTYCARRKRSRQPRSSGSRSGRTARTTMARSTSSATYTAASTSWRRCWAGSATRSRRRRPPPGSPATAWSRPPGARRSSWATWWTAGRTRPPCCAW